MLAVNDDRAAIGGIVLYLLFSGSTLTAAVPSNSVWVEAIDRDQSQRAITISRVFAQGEIQHFAQAVIEGTAVLTQCDVKTRWPDQSVQHALVSFVLNLPSRRPVEVRFINQKTLAPTRREEGFSTRNRFDDTSYLNQDEMLNFNGGNWGARIEASSGGHTYSVDVREMLRAGAWRYWMRGPIVTQVIVEGRDVNTESLFAYDFGWRCESQCEQPYDQAVWKGAEEASHRSIHPIFVLTFYHNHAGVKVEVILENLWTGKLQDQRYDIKLYVGGYDPVYSRQNVIHIAKTRWRKVFWSGTHPSGWIDEANPGLSVNYNLPYLIYSRILPNYDTGLKLSKAGRDSELADFRKKNGSDETQFCTDRMYCGQWLRYFGTGGGRGEIALIPRWYVRYLYTFDADLYANMINNALVSGVVPIHVRESEPGIQFLEGIRKEQALGRHLSLDARPTARTMSTQGESTPRDRWRPVGPVSCLYVNDFACTSINPSGRWVPGTVNNWAVDLAHQPSFAYIPYLITGDWYFLQEVYSWAAFTVAMGNVRPTCDTYCRHGNWGYINWFESERAEAWGMRNLAHAAFVAPSESVEKLYFTRLIENNIAVREGRFDIRDGAFFKPNPGGTPENPCPLESYDPERATRWCWGRVTVGLNMRNPLKFMTKGVNIFIGVDRSKAASTDSVWQHNYHRIVLGHLNELGFPVRRLQEEVARGLIHQLRDNSYNPFLAIEYLYAVRRKSDGSYIDNWDEVKQAFISSSALRRDMENGDNVFEIEDLVNTGEGHLRLDMAQTVKIDDELVRICSAQLITEDGKYVGTRVQVCANGRGWDGTKREWHAAGTRMHRLFNEIPTIHATMEHGYGVIVRAAASFAFDLTSIDSDGQTVIRGQEAWDWIDHQLSPYLDEFNHNPMWAIIPRNDERLATPKRSARNVETAVSSGKESPVTSSQPSITVESSALLSWNSNHSPP